MGITDGPHLRRTWGWPDLTYIWMSLSSPHTKPTTSNQKLSPFSLKYVGGTLKGGGRLAWFSDGPSTSPDSSRDSPTCLLGHPGRSRRPLLPKSKRLVHQRGKGVVMTQMM